MRDVVRTWSIGIVFLALAGCIPAQETWHVTAKETVRVGERAEMGFELLSISKDGTTIIRLESGKVYL